MGEQIVEQLHSNDKLGWRFPETKDEAMNKLNAGKYYAVIVVGEDFSRSLYDFLDKLPDALRPGGRVAILTFHSGEDRLVKRAFKAGAKAGVYSEVSKDVIRPSAEECVRNPRARSTKMRWAVKTE